MSTGPNQILLKRSDTVTSVPSGLSFGEPGINTASGKLFFQEQIDGTVTGRMLSFHGFTNESFVTDVNGVTGSIAAVNSLNGLTGTALINAGTNITLTAGAGGITVDAFGAGSNVTSFNGATGAVEGVGSFNGATGAVEGVGSFNGATGAVVTDTLILPCVGISLNAGGITFPDGTHQTTASRAGLKYTVTTSTPSAGGVKISIDLGGVVDNIVLHDTDANGNDISAILTLFASNGGYIQCLKEDGSVLTAIAIDATEASAATFGSDVLNITLVDGSSGTFEVDGAPSNGDVVYVTVVPNTLSAVATIGGDNIWNKNNINVRNGLTVENETNVGYLGVDERAIEFEVDGSGGRVKGITFDDGTFQSTAAGLTHTDENFTVADHTKLNGIEASADVTDAANVTSAGALMDSELTSIADVKALDQSVVSGANPVFTFISALAGISVGAGGVTFSDGSNQTVAWNPTSAISLSGGDTSTASLTITSNDNGSDAAPIIDLIRDPADDGNGTNGDYLGQIKFKGQSNSGTERVYGKISGKIGSATNGDEDGVVEHMVQRDGSSQIVFRTKKSGILLNDDSGTPMELGFSDGTAINTALRTDSYTGQIETAADKTYTLDPKVATARTITGFYIKSASGTVTATLKNGSDTIKAASVSSSSGDQSSLGNTSVSADAVLTLVTSSNSSALDVIFNVEYTAAL